MSGNQEPGGRARAGTNLISAGDKLHQIRDAFRAAGSWEITVEMRSGALWAPPRLPQSISASMSFLLAPHATARTHARPSGPINS